MTRRGFLHLLAAGSSLPLFSAFRPDFSRSFDIPGRIVNPSPVAGHLMRAQRSWDSFPPPDQRSYDVVIVGGGISGLSAAWKLIRSGVERLLLLEVEAELGGTSIATSGSGQIHPWAAHYINIPPREADCIHELLVDIGLIESYDAAGRPQVDPENQVRWPHERLFVDGRWVEGLDPFSAASGRELEEWHSFEDDMLRWTLYRGVDGRRGFAMPLAYSTGEESVRALDRISMGEYLRERGWKSRSLRWLIDYACRDDYGGTSESISAWAGIHYWACRFYDRRLREEYPTDTLTWPEGNAFLAGRMALCLGEEQYRTNCPVLRVEEDGEQILVRYSDLRTGEQRTVRAKSAVYAGKLHTAPFVIAGLSGAQRSAMAGLAYCPWLVASVQLSRPPQEGKVGMAWDNVIMDSHSLGYVRADHQRPSGDDLTLIYYWPFVEESEKARRELLNRPREYWTGPIVNDLLRVHPDIADLVERIDIYRWGHAMVRPEPGVIWGEESKLRRRSLGNIHLATCDATGLPLFEEAVYNGIRAAERCMDGIGVIYETSLKGLVDV